MKIIDKHWKKLMILLLSFLLALGGFTMAHFSDRLSQTIKITTGNYADVNYLPLSEMTPGSTIKINENGSPVEFYIATHNYESDLNESGRTLLVRKDCYDSRQWHSTDTANEYATSAIDTWLNGDYKALFDEDIISIMGTTKFYYTEGGTSIFVKVSTLERSIFLLSATELGKTADYASTEGSSLPIASTLEIAYMNGTAVDQWTRSRYTLNSDAACALNASGDIGHYKSNGTHGSRPCFTLPGTLLINEKTGEPYFDNSSVALTGIEVTTAPTKTTYAPGDTFDPAGMVITATYADGTKKEVTDYTVTDGSVLMEGQTSVTISYTENGVTKTVTQEVTVEKALAIPVLAAQNTWYKGESFATDITGEISIVDSYTPTGSEDEFWDASAAGDGSVMAYRIGSSLILAGNGSGKIMANADSSYAFKPENGYGVFTLSGIDLLDTSQVTNMNSMFLGYSCPTNLDLSSFDTSQVTDMSRMFYECTNLISLDLSGWDTSQVTNMKSMFFACDELTNLDLSSFDTSKVTDMSYMFDFNPGFGLDKITFGSKFAFVGTNGYLPTPKGVTKPGGDGKWYSVTTGIGYAPADIPNNTADTYIPYPILSSISVTTEPTKTTYNSGDNFDPTGMVITATYANGTTKEVTDYTVTDGSGLTDGQTTVTISYTERGVTKTVTQAITVKTVSYATLSELSPGSTIRLNESGSPVEFYVATHDYESGLNGPGRTLLVRKDCYDTRKMADVLNFAYPSSDMDTWLNGDYKVLLDANVQAATETTKLYSYVECGDDAVTTLERSVFLLSLTELGKTYNNYDGADGTTLPIASTLQIAYLNGSASSQWTRSTQAGSNNGIHYLNKSGVVYTYASSGKYGSRPCFTLPGTLLINEDTSEPDFENSSTILAGIIIDTPPDKTTYTPGENFDPAGMVVKAVYRDGSRKTITDYTVIDGTDLAEGQTTVTISYAEDGVTKTVSQEITAKTITSVTLSELTPGSTIKLNESGNPVEFYVATHDYESDLNGAGRTLLVRKDCYDQRAMYSSIISLSNKYAGSSMDTWLNGDYKALLDSEVQAAIGTTQFYYTVEGSPATLTTLDRSVFLLSLTEFGKEVSYANVEGTALPIASTLQVGYISGSAVNQWTRSPALSTGNYFCMISSSGSTNKYTSQSKIGSRPAFTLPGTLLMDEETGQPVFDQSTVTSAEN